MASDLHLHGVWIPLITPFDTSGAVDVDAIERLCGEYLADGVAGIVALGTTGESPTLDADEKRAVIEACSRVCAARGAPLIVGTGTNNTRSTIAETQALEGIPGGCRRARRRALLHPAVGGRDRRALPRRRRREPGADRRVQHSGAHRPWARRAQSLLELAAHPERRRRQASRRDARSSTRSGCSPARRPASAC